MRGDGDLGAAGGYRFKDTVGSVFDRGGEDGGAGGELEPAALFFYLADVLGVGFSAGAHETGADGGDAYAFVAELGVKTFGEAYEGELAGVVGQKVRH